MQVTVKKDGKKLVGKISKKNNNRIELIDGKNYPMINFREELKIFLEKEIER